MSGRWLTAGALLILAVGWGSGCSAPAVPMAEARASVSLSEPVRFYVAGTPIILDVSVFNAGQETLMAGPEPWNGDHFQLQDARRELLTGQPLAGVQGEPLAAGQRTARPVDVTALFPQLRQPGLYTLTVVFPSYRSNTVAIRIIAAFDPQQDYLADVVTDRGTFTLRFFPEVAPEHVKNFINLARSGYYDNVIVHRVLPGVMFQTGDPSSSGRGGPGWTLQAEFNDRPHQRGTLSMARQADNPHSAGGQWFVCLDRVADWDRQYTVFGEVAAGMETVDAIGHVKVRKEVPQEVITLQQVVIRQAGGEPGR
jgi:cyclophilin family peptidyl-prolyl cis-trans isomerase